MKSLIYAYKQYSTGQKWLFQRSTKPLSDAPGNKALLSHLRAAKNLEERNELADGRLIKLYRPLDFSYAKSWASGTRHLLNCERDTITGVLELLERDKSIWLSFE